MTQPNQSELDECTDDLDFDWQRYIAANYTPNSEVADKVNTAVVTRELELDHQWSKELERKLKEVK